tara:strand:- start:276 stop:665 length:390 start_codon:yes stop_codon:yes gene_type:complete
MTFDPKDLELLRTLGRKLPQNIAPKPTRKKEKVNDLNKKESSLSPKKPGEFFQDFIDNSPDGKVSPNIISELKRLEKEEQERLNLNSSKLYDLKSIKKLGSNTNKKNERIKKQELYSAFERLLLEEEEI